MDKAAIASDAATVLLVRDADNGPEIYMVKRHGGNKFMANAHVFVGGRVDQSDSEAISYCRGIDQDNARAILGADHSCALSIYIAAIRETFEESGILIAEDDQGKMPSDSTFLNEIRSELNQGQKSFEALLDAYSLTLPLNRMRYLARWVTPEVEPRRFDARFFVCVAPEQQEATFDPKETTAGEWHRIDDILQAAEIRQVQLAPPTLAVLQDLQSCTSAAEIVNAAPNKPIEAICPRFFGGAMPNIVLLLPGDHRFDDQSSSSGQEHYVIMEDGYWRRVRS